MAFSPEAFEAQPPISEPEWLRKRQRFGRHGAGGFEGCAVNAENHLERTVLEAFRKLRSKPLGRLVTVGGLYGERHGEGEEVRDDPAVELLLELQKQQRGLRALCLGCEEQEVKSLTRARSLQEARFSGFEIHTRTLYT